MAIEPYWIRLYWLMRLGMVLLWLWTAYVSWYVYPHAESLQLLRRLGITTFESQVLIAACILDAGMGVASALWPNRLLWLLQIALVAGYSLIIAWGLPEFLYQPFGPLTKNLAVLACLLYLYGIEKMQRRKN